MTVITDTPHSIRGTGTSEQISRWQRTTEQIRPWLQAISPGRKIGLVATLVGALWGIPSMVYWYRSAEPRLSAPVVDAERPLEPPFTISNEHMFYTLLNVHPSCAIRSITTDTGGKLRGIGWNDDRDVGNIPPGEQRAARCPMGTLFHPAKFKITSAELDMVVSYQVQWFPGVKFPYKKRRTFSFARTGSGAGFWTDKPLRPDNDNCNGPCEPNVVIEVGHITPRPAPAIR